LGTEHKRRTVTWNALVSEILGLTLTNALPAVDNQCMAESLAYAVLIVTLTAGLFIAAVLKAAAVETAARRPPVSPPAPLLYRPRTRGARGAPRRLLRAG
jgi:hypothetical protein